MLLDFRIMQTNMLSWHKHVSRLLPEFVNIIASFITIITLIAALFYDYNGTKIELSLIRFLCGLFIFVFGFVVVQEYRYSRKARYAEAMYSMHSCIHFLRDYYHEIEKLQDIDCKHHLTNVVTSFANAFSLVTGTHCRACIEILNIGHHISPDEYHKITDDNQRVKYLYANTFCRDVITANSNTEMVLDDYLHPIMSNSDFRELFLNYEKRFFLCKDVRYSDDYYQSTAAPYGQELPYKSIIVWPIRRLVYAQDEECSTNLNQRQDIIGYLCVDSARRDVFNKNYDIEMGAIVADALFTFLKYYHHASLKKKSIDNKTQNV